MQNTCRSVAAEAVFSYLIKETNQNAQASSAGLSTSDGLPALKQIQEAGHRRGYDLSRFRSHQLTSEDLEKSDYLLAMDDMGYQTLQQMSKQYAEKTALLMQYANFFTNREILYPQQNDIAEFSKIFDLIEDACLGLYHHIFDDKSDQ